MARRIGEKRGEHKGKFTTIFYCGVKPSLIASATVTSEAPKKDGRIFSLLPGDRSGMIG
jgi:hypothetical protein